MLNIYAVQVKHLFPGAWHIVERMLGHMHGVLSKINAVVHGFLETDSFVTDAFHLSNLGIVELCCPYLAGRLT